MKKLLFLAAVMLVSTTAMAQTSFGVTAGYTNMSIKSSFEGMSASVSESGFFVGALADFTISEAFHVQPGVNYASIQDASMLYIPVMAKYYVGATGFNIQAGPQGTLILEEVGGGTNTFGLDLGFGAGYDITENFFLEARYALELTNRLTDASVEGISGDPKVRINTLQVGVGYKF